MNFVDAKGILLKQAMEQAPINIESFTEAWALEKY